MITDYLDSAKRHSSIHSDRALAKAIGIKGPSLAQYKTGRSLPSDETMLRLSDLAGIPAEQAILDLAVYRSNSERSKALLLNLKKKLVSIALTMIVVLASTMPATANALENNAMFIISPKYTLCDKLTRLAATLKRLWLLAFWKPGSARS